jgi:hypothetical protein
MATTESFKDFRNSAPAAKKTHRTSDINVSWLVIMKIVSIYFEQKMRSVGGMS